MNIILDGPEATGKTTLANKLEEKYGFQRYHLTKETPNDYEFHMSLLDTNKMVYDRFCLCEAVYTKIYNRTPKISEEEILAILSKIISNEDIMIIFYASDIEVLKERLIERGEHEFLDEIERQNTLWYETAKAYFDKLNYTRFWLIDISKSNAYKDLDIKLDVYITESERVRK